MKYHPITSSNLTSVAYDPVRRVLGVQFTGGGKFEYPAVAPEQHAAMMASASIGSYFSRHLRVRKNHPGVQIK